MAITANLTIVQVQASTSSIWQTRILPHIRKPCPSKSIEYSHCLYLALNWKGDVKPRTTGELRTHYWTSFNTDNIAFLIGCKFHD